MSSIFLSHNHADKSFVRRLAQDLQAAGVRVWLDEAEMMIGDSLIEKIRQGIDEMDYLGVILSQNSVRSEWVKREVNVAMHQEIEGKQVKVLPVMVQDCELPGFLKEKLYADFRDPQRYHEELNKILRRLRPPLIISPHPPRPPEPRPPNIRKYVFLIIYVLLFVVIALVVISILYPKAQGVYSLVDMQSGEKITSNMIEIQSNRSRISKDQPTEKEHIVGFCAMKALPRGTRLTLDNIGNCKN
jgi:hypothetical protein